MNFDLQDYITPSLNSKYVSQLVLFCRVFQGLSNDIWMGSIGLTVFEKMSKYRPDEFFNKMAWWPRGWKKSAQAKIFSTWGLNRKNLDLSVKMNALSNWLVKIEKKNLAPAAMFGGLVDPLLNMY